jgi:hypothetical protein
MEKKLLDWIHNNRGKWFTPERKTIFRSSRILDYKITKLDQRKKQVRIQFGGRSTPALPLDFWMFDRVIDQLEKQQDFMMLGARLQPPYPKGSLEEAIWTKPYPRETSEYKVSPHICDILNQYGILSFGYTKNPNTGRTVQAAKLEDGGTDGNGPEKDFTQTVRDWTKQNLQDIIEARASYQWGSKSTIECVKERNEVSRTIMSSRIKNGGAVSLEALDRVMAWGGFGSFPLREPEKVLETTRRAFDFLDNGEIEESVLTLLSVHQVGIASATKIIGLSDQYRYAVYDSRVGTALRSLTYKGERVVKCPAGRSRQGDICSDSAWARNYVKLLEVLEIMGNVLNEESYPFNVTDVEMALFMMGK